MREMSRDEAIEFLSAGTRTGKLATVRSDGRPHVVPVWFVVDADDLVFNTGNASTKVRNLERDPRAAVVVDLEEQPYAFVMVEGTAAFSSDPIEVREFATRIGGRYMGEDRADEFGERNGVPGEIVVRIHIDRIISANYVSD